LFWGGVPRGTHSRNPSHTGRGRGEEKKERKRERERETKSWVVVVVVVVGVPENGWVGRKKESGVKQQKERGI
jgi:hypothetical protein